MSTLVAQGQARKCQEKLITGLQSKAKQTQYSRFTSFYEGPHSVLEENKSEICCLLHAAVSSLVFRQKLKYACKRLGAF